MALDKKYLTILLDTIIVKGEEEFLNSLDLAIPVVTQEEVIKFFRSLLFFPLPIGHDFFSEPQVIGTVYLYAFFRKHNNMTDFLAQETTALNNLRFAQINGTIFFIY